MPYRKQLLALCRLVAPHGSVMWTTANGVRFQFYHGSVVWASIENKQTGVTTEVWDSDSGWRTKNEVLRQWFIEAVPLVESEYHDSVRADLDSRARWEAELADQFPSRFTP